MKFEIKNISIKGFRNYKEEVAYNLGRKVKILGGNGLGKSTVKEAICWAVLGTDSNGNERATTSLINNQKPKITEVVLDFVMDEESHTIIRRKKGSTNEVYLDQAKSSTSDILKELFVSKDIFLSIFNPYYFPSLAPKDAKSILSDVCKPVGQDTVFAELGDYLKDVMLKNGFRIPETFLSDCRDNLKEQEQNITYLEGKIDGLKPQEVPEKLTFDKQEELDSLKKELSNIQAPVSLEAQLKELDIEEKSAVSEFNNISYQPLKDVATLKKQKDKCLEEYKDNERQIKLVKEEHIDCPQCDAHIDVSSIKKEPLIKFRDGIIKKGKELAVEIEKAETYNEEVNEKNIELKEQKKIELDEKLAEINARREEIKLNIQTQEEEYKKATEGLQDRIKVLEEEKKQVEINNTLVENIETNNASIEKTIKEAKEGITNSKNKIAQLKLAIDAGKQYNSIKVKKQAEQIGEYLNKVTIQFEVVNKDGEIKDKFAVLYEGKEFNKLSNSERIKAGLEISNLIMHLNKTYLPVFVDDAESINVIPELDTQMISAYVVDSDEIKVEVVE